MHNALSIGVVTKANKKALAICSARGPYRSIRNTLKPRFSPNATDSLVAKVRMPRSQDKAIFLLTTTRTARVYIECIGKSSFSVNSKVKPHFKDWPHANELNSLFQDSGGSVV